MIQKVLINGAGIAGLAAARAFKRINPQIHVEVAEAFSQLRYEGAGIALPQNAVEGLHLLGLSNAVNGYKTVEQVQYLNKQSLLTSGSLLQKPLGRYPFKAVHRQYLIEDLAEGLEPYIHFNHQALGFANQGDHVEVQFNDGSTERFDLVIGADGLHSKTRQHLIPGQGVQDLQVPCWRFVAQYDTRDLQPQYYLGNGDIFMIYPIGAGQVYCYCHVPGSQLDQAQANNPKAYLSSQFKDYAQPVTQLIEQVSDDDITAGRLKTVGLLPYLYDQRMVLMGDAAHACSPMLQQGAGMAFEDAWSLAYLVDHFGIDKGLSFYQQFRLEHAHWVVSTSNEATHKVAQPVTQQALQARDYHLSQAEPINIANWKLMFNKSFAERLKQFVAKKEEQYSLFADPDSKFEKDVSSYPEPRLS